MDPNPPNSPPISEGGTMSTKSLVSKYIVWITLFFAFLAILILVVFLWRSSSELTQYQEVVDAEVLTPLPPGELNWLAHWQDEGLREQLVYEVKTEFEFLNPDVELNMLFHQDVGADHTGDVADMIVDMIEKGEYDYDVIWINTGVYREVAERLDDPNWGEKYLVNFGELDWFESSHKDFITTQEDIAANTGGMHIGPYIEGFTSMLWYNKNVADTLGLEIKNEGMTYEDFKGYLQTVFEYNKTASKDIIGLVEYSDWITSEKLFQSLFKSEIGDFETAKAPEYTPEKEAALLKTLQAYEELSQYSPLNADHSTLEWWDNRGKALEEEVLFLVNGSWMYNHWMAIDTELIENMYPAELPTFQEIDFYVGSYTPQFAVFKEAPNKDAAIRLQKLWSKPQMAEKWVRYTKSMTGIKGNIQLPSATEDQFEEFQQQITDKYAGRLHYADDVAHVFGTENKLLGSELSQTIIKVLDGDMTATEALSYLKGLLN